MEQKKSIHSGHRERLTNLVDKSGIENVSPIQAVEFFLTYIIPRGDVNPLAHRLLDKFETFGNILDASENDLKSVVGINTRSAKKIKLYREVMRLYTSSRMTKKLNINENKDFLDMLEQLLRFENTENLYIFAFNNKYQLLQKRRYDLKKVRSVGISAYELYDFLSSSKPSYLMVAHNHPGGTARHSDEDAEAFTYMDSLLTTFDCEIIDSLVVGDDGIFSTKQNAFIRYFDMHVIEK